MFMEINYYLSKKKKPRIKKTDSNFENQPTAISELSLPNINETELNLSVNADDGRHHEVSRNKSSSLSEQNNK